MSAHQSPHDGTEHTFTDTLFTCKNDNGCGGAIDPTNGGTLIIKRCIFDSCSCSERGGAVSYRGEGTCSQEDNLYAHCMATDASGAFNSFETLTHALHHQKRCMYLNSEAKHYGHFCIEYSQHTLVDSNIYIHVVSLGDLPWARGTVVNHHAQGPIVYSDCLFSDGKAVYSGGLTFLGEYTTNTASFSVKFCFFLNNFGTDGTAREIYFDGNTTHNANKDRIIHSFSATPGSSVFVENESTQDKDWLFQGYTVVEHAYRY